MNLIIRKALKSDAPELLRLMVQLISKPLQLEEVERRLDFIATSPIEELYVCTRESAGDIVGKEEPLLGALGFRVRENIEDYTRYGEISVLVTDREIRRLGVGRQLMEYAERLAEDRGCIGTWLVSGIEREEAHQFYKRLGYEITGYRFVKAGEKH
jgi:GNAT superfamily N-acetyltransferase